MSRQVFFFLLVLPRPFGPPSALVLRCASRLLMRSSQLIGLPDLATAVPRPLEESSSSRQNSRFDQEMTEITESQHWPCLVGVAISCFSILPSPMTFKNSGLSKDCTFPTPSCCKTTERDTIQIGLVTAEAPSRWTHCLRNTEESWKAELRCSRLDAGRAQRCCTVCVACVRTIQSPRDPRPAPTLRRSGTNEAGGSADQHHLCADAPTLGFLKVHKRHSSSCVHLHNKQQNMLLK